MLTDLWNGHWWRGSVAHFCFEWP